ncbi:MAG: glycosyltransferase family 2 protein [Yaniella sp.]|uniref:glycosyltransferase family 2 protein n=1 Tax=Yaniella sp. TaxID=2773929 RepID=UPI003F9D7639
MRQHVLVAPEGEAFVETLPWSDNLLDSQIAEALIFPCKNPARYLTFALPNSPVSYERSKGPLGALEMWFLSDGSLLPVEVAEPPSLDDAGLLDFTSATNVTEIFAYLEKLKELVNPRTAHVWYCAKRLLSEYLAQELNDLPKDSRREFVDHLATQNEAPIDWKLAARPANALAVLYNFSPYADTGATVASKRLRQFCDVFDVISCSHEGRKKIDTSIDRINAPYISSHRILNVPVAWATTGAITGFASKARQAAAENIKSGSAYDYIYSRAMWIHSHFAAAAIKSENPDLRWIAEFSDPLSLDVEGQPRKGEAPDQPFFQELIAPIIDEYGPQEHLQDTVFGAAELIVYAKADSIIFTNELQMQTMLDRVTSTALRERIHDVAIVSNHPTLPEDFYAAEDVEYAVDDSLVNLAYFGEFYSNRGLQDLTAAIRSLPAGDRERVHLHVFTDYAPSAGSKPRGMSQKSFDALVNRAIDGIAAEGLEGQIHLNPSLPYLKFIGITSRFDYLIVTDTRSGAGHAVNPYLPSKWSDYAGSQAKTWAFVEEGSCLSAKPADIITLLNDTGGTLSALQSMLRLKVDTHQSVAPPHATPNAKTLCSGKSTPDERKMFEQEKVGVGPFNLDEIEGIREQKWATTLPLLQNRLSKLIAPASRGALYATEPERILRVVASEDDLEPESVESVNVTAVAVEEPFSKGSQECLEWIPYRYGLDARAAVSSIAMELASIARSTEAGAIVVDARTISSLSGLIAARRIGVPFVLKIEDPSDVHIVLAAPLEEDAERPVLALRRRVFYEADAIISKDPELIRTLRMLGRTVISDENSWPRLTVDEPATTSPRILMTKPSRLIEALSRVADVSFFDNFEDSLRGAYDAFVLDLRDAWLEGDLGAPQLSSLETLEAIEDLLRKQREVGTRTIVIMSKDQIFSEKTRGVRQLADVISTEDLAHIAKLIGEKGSFTSTVIAPIGASAPDALKVTDAEPGMAWDQWAAKLVAGEDGIPPVRSGNSWDSDRAVMRSRSLLASDAEWADYSRDRAVVDGLHELAQGHSGIDIAVHLLRTAGIRVDHPRHINSVVASNQDRYTINISNSQLVCPDWLSHNQAAVRLIKDLYRLGGESEIAVTRRDGDVVFETHDRTIALPSTNERLSPLAPEHDSSGISLVLATFKGATRIGEMLDSIAKQTLDHRYIQVVVVPNGPSDGTEDVVKAWSALHPTIDVKLLGRLEGGVANARNVGLRAANRQFITFVDDDDYLGINYLWSMFVRADRDVVVLGTLMDVDEETRVVSEETSLNKRVTSIGRSVVTLTRYWGALSLNAGKLIPAWAAKQIEYDSTLRSTEDQIYMIQLLRFNLYVTGPRQLDDSAYMRIKRFNSISRRPADFDFNVTQRLDAMTRFRDLTRVYDSPQLAWGAKSMARWHAVAIVRYAESSAGKEELPRIREAIRNADFADHPEFGSLRGL